MATLTTTEIPALKAMPVPAERGASATRRRISPQAGRALELLGHAIEYLTDEYLHEGGAFAPDDGRLQAIQLLISVNRQVYFECPEVPTLSQRFLALLHLAEPDRR